MIRMAKILAIETSCYETSVAIVLSGKTILSNIISSQIDIHKRFGGVVPELACRAHEESLLSLIDEALEKANCSLSDIDAFAVTYGPGLIGALMVGLSCAKALAFYHKKPLIGVNHIEAHIYANFMEKDITLPALGLVVSGGHTLLTHVKSWGDYNILGQTYDDAAGEAFDKVAKMLGLGYPGGPVIDRLAKKGNPSAISFPRGKIKENPFAFSFSGLKTAVLYYLKRNPHAKVEDVAASFQEAVVDSLCEKTFKAIEHCNVNCLSVGGGVALNSRLREKMFSISTENGVDVTFPSFGLAADNAAMIAGLAYEQLSRGKECDLTLEASPNLSLVNWL